MSKLRSFWSSFLFSRTTSLRYEKGMLDNRHQRKDLEHQLKTGVMLSYAKVFPESIEVGRGKRYPSLGLHEEL